MIPSEVQARIKSHVWKAIAQNEIDVSGLDDNSLDKLVDFVVDAAMLEMDNQLTDSLAEDKNLEPDVFAESDKADEETDRDDEIILWEGRPFLSMAERYTITNERIRITKGILGRSRENIELIRVEDVDYQQNFSERMFFLGDIHVRSHDPKTPQIVLRNIQDPEGVYEILRRAVKAARKGYQFSFQEEM